MEESCADELNVSTPTYVDGEIGELRKFIVEMMQAEVMLMESIRLNEHNLADTNAHIKHLKELIAQEHARFKALNGMLECDSNELKNYEEKSVDAEAKHRKFRDAVTQCERDVQVLRARYQQTRGAMLNLRCQISEATTNLEMLLSKEKFVESETQNATAAIKECPEPSGQRADRQKLRAKIQYTQQLIAQTNEENILLGKKCATLEDEISVSKKENCKLHESIFIKEKDTKVLFSRLRDNTVCVVKENGKIESKLMTKRRKYQLKTKNEISTLKRRISVVTSELDKGQMTNEDTQSSISALCAKREALEQSILERNEQIVLTESAITELSTSIVALGQNGGKFDTAHLEEALSAKRDDAQAILRVLEEKKKNLNLLEADNSRLGATLNEMCARGTTAKNLVDKLDGELVSLSKGIEEQEAERRSLSTSIDDANKKNDDLQTKYEDIQRENESIIQIQTTLRRQQLSLLEQERQLASEIKAAELLSQTLRDGIKHGEEYAERLRQTNALCGDKDKRIEFELRRQELNLQQQCAQVESQFEAEVAALDEKIKLVERQLCSA